MKKYLGDWETKEDAEKGLQNLQSMLDQQGQELGTLRKSVETVQTQNAGQQATQAEDAKEAEYQAAAKDVESKIKALDPLEDGYAERLAKLIAKSNSISAQRQHEKTLTEAASLFQSELDQRDSNAAQTEFLEAHPDFQTPEMQTRIEEKIGADKTGLLDPLTAYWALKSEDAQSQAESLSAENEELKKLVDIKDGTKDTSKVIANTDNGTDKQVKTKKTGAELKKGMLDAVMAAT